VGKSVVGPYQAIGKISVMYMICLIGLLYARGVFPFIGIINLIGMIHPIGIYNMMGAIHAIIRIDRFDPIGRI
jgi:hypothetical protein